MSTKFPGLSIRNIYYLYNFILILSMYIERLEIKKINLPVFVKILNMFVSCIIIVFGNATVAVEF